MITITRLKDIREDNDISQVKMAKILKVNRSTYSLWELGINIIPLKNLCDFADYFNYSIDYILGLTNKRKYQNLIKGFDLKLLGSNIKKNRILKGLSQENLANTINVTQACINKYEKGLIYISTSNLYKLSKEFNISISQLCGKEKQESKVLINT